MTTVVLNYKRLRETDGGVLATTLNHLVTKKLQKQQIIPD
jgi:hypothetical protein